MRCWDLTSAMARLDQAAESLRKAQAEVTELWNDDVSRQFQKEFLEPLGPKLSRAIEAIRRLGEELAKAERACGPES